MRIAIVVAAAVAGQLVVNVTTAAAEYPGRNGLIYFTTPNDDPNNGTACGVASVTAAGRGYNCVALGGINPSVSPNDRLIAETFGIDGPSQINTFGLTGAHERTLTHTSFDNLGPRFSPDGRRIVFYQRGGASDGIYVMNANGSGRRQLTADNGVTPMFSPNGAVIAYAATGLAIANADGSGSHNLLPNTETSTPISPTESNLAVVTYLEPNWSPDGRRIVFVKQTDAGTQTCDPATGECTAKRTGRKQQLEIINANGSGLRQLTSGPGDEVPSWSPDGRQIAYFRQAPSKVAGVGNISVIKPDGSGNREIALGTLPFWSTVVRPIPPRPRIGITMSKLNPKRGCFNPFTDGFGVSVLTKTSKLTGFKILFYVDGRIWDQKSDGRNLVTEPNRGRGHHRIKIVVSDFALHDTVTRTASYTQC